MRAQLRRVEAQPPTPPRPVWRVRALAGYPSDVFIRCDTALERAVVDVANAAALNIFYAAARAPEPYADQAAGLGQPVTETDATLNAALANAIAAADLNASAAPDTLGALAGGEA